LVFIIFDTFEKPLTQEMEKDRTIIFFFICLGIGFVISAIKVTICQTRDVQVMYAFYYTVLHNFYASLLISLPAMIGTVIYQYYKNQKKKK
jgi:hypothetical protein